MSTFPKDLLIDFSEFTVYNKTDTANPKAIVDHELSSTALDRILMRTHFKAYAEDGVIGYVTSDVNESYRYGITHAEAYSHWIENVKVFEKKIRQILGATFTLTQCEYDGLVSFLVNTGQLNTVTTVSGSYDLKTQILAKEWSTVASMIARDKTDSNSGGKDTSTIMLGDQGIVQSKSWSRNRGLQRLRRTFATLRDGYKIRQAEHTYYRETQQFLPNMSELRKREVVQHYRSTL